MVFFFEALLATEDNVIANEKLHEPGLKKDSIIVAKVETSGRSEVIVLIAFA